MATMYAESSDGYQASGLKSTWNDAHDNVGQSSPWICSTVYNFAIGAEYVPGRNKYYIRRTFFDFDTSAISITPSNLILNIYITSTSYDNSPLIILKSGHDPTDFTEDWYSTWLTGLGGTISGWSNTDSEVVLYSKAVLTAGQGSGYAEIPLNSQARQDMVNNSSLKMVVMDYTYDYMDYAPTAGGAANYTGIHYVNYTGTSRDPKLTFGGGYHDGDVSGVINASVGKVNGVATDNLGEVNGI